MPDSVLTEWEHGPSVWPTLPGPLSCFSLQTSPEGPPVLFKVACLQFPSGGVAGPQPGPAQMLHNCCMLAQLQSSTCK